MIIYILLLLLVLIMLCGIGFNCYCKDTNIEPLTIIKEPLKTDAEPLNAASNTIASEPLNASSNTIASEHVNIQAKTVNIHTTEPPRYINNAHYRYITPTLHNSPSSGWPAPPGFDLDPTYPTDRPGEYIIVRVSTE